MTSFSVYIYIYVYIYIGLTRASITFWNIAHHQPLVKVIEAKIPMNDITKPMVCFRGGSWFVFGVVHGLPR